MRFWRIFDSYIGEVDTRWKALQEMPLMFGN
jgi:hypothetical protein